MSKLFASFLMIIAIVLICINIAEAARFGGGKSFGVHRSFNSYSRAQTTNRVYSQTQSAVRSSWVAPMVGMALGGLLAYLMMSHGWGSGLLSWFILFSLGLMIWNFLRSKQTARSYAAAGQGRGRVFEAEHYTAQVGEGYTESRSVSYDTEFLREAKAYFIRLQAAYDTKYLQDLREFTTPEVFAEVQLQLQERGQQANYTEVVSLNAELLETSSDQRADLASVKFSGVIREAQDQSSAFFEEIWHFRKDPNRSKWIVAGVQQQDSST